MNTNRSNLFLIFSVIFLNLCISIKSTKAQVKEEVIKELNGFAKLLRISPMDMPHNYAQYSSILNSKKLIGLGESTHGTKEFNEVRASIIIDLIMFQNLRTIAIESEACGIESINNFLHGEPLGYSMDTLESGPDSVAFVIKYSSLFGIYRTKEFYELLKWVREYNASQPKVEKVSFVGIDMQDPYTIGNSMLNDKGLSLFLEKEDLASLDHLKKIFWSRKQPKLTKQDNDAFQLLIKKLRIYCEGINDKEEQHTSKQYVRLLEQSLELVGKNISMHVYSNLRDKFMAENVLWHLQKLGEEDKMVLLAHNGHIAHTDKVSKVKSMGFHLRSELGDKYYALALTFDEGSVRIFDFKGERKYKNFPYISSENRKSIEYIFKNMEHENFFLDLDTTMSEALQKQLNSSKNMRVIGAEYQPNRNKDYLRQPILESFDGIIFIRNAVGAVTLFN
jgi:erythromycin esterase